MAKSMHDPKFMAFVPIGRCRIFKRNPVCEHTVSACTVRVVGARRNLGAPAADLVEGY